ncbi:hypothetical protein B0H13DRAFT_1874812 [Mycena leptocephala]|nr:hypothetical protein B0H13DRAFT_1874812 [Mycena leptocephala]
MPPPCLDAWTPFLLITFCEEWRTRSPLSEFFGELLDLRSRRERGLWYERLVQELLKKTVWLELFHFWATTATGLDTSDIMTTNLRLHVYRTYRDKSATTRFVDTKDGSVWHGQHQTRQRNVVQEYDLDGDTSSEEDMDSDYDDEDEGHATPLAELVLSDPSVNQPIRGRDKTLWNQLIFAAPEAWPGKIDWWVETLRNGFISPPCCEKCATSGPESTGSGLGGLKSRQTFGKRIDDGNTFIAALQRHTFLIPQASYPQAVFFALGADNFTKMWHAYLGAGRSSKEHDLYSNLIQCLKQREAGSGGLDSVQDPELQIILKRTLVYKALKKQVNHFVYRHKPRATTNFRPNAQTHVSPRKPGTKSLPLTPDYCEFCAGLAPELRCVQRIPVTSKKIDPAVVGCAISKAPPGEQMAPIPPRTKFNKDGTPKKPPRILHPDDPLLQLTFYSADKDRLERCSRHLLLFVDSAQRKSFQLDFYLFNAFAPDVLQRLLKHHEELTGPRVACGRGDGDALRLYEGMEAATKAGLNALFNHAEDTLIIQETARAVCPELVRRRNEVTRACDRLGQVGTTLYDCTTLPHPYIGTPMLAISACVPKSCCNPFESYLNTLSYMSNGELLLSLKATLFALSIMAASSLQIALSPRNTVFLRNPIVFGLGYAMVIPNMMLKEANQSGHLLGATIQQRGVAWRWQKGMGRSYAHKSQSEIEFVNGTISEKLQTASQPTKPKPCHTVSQPT